MNKKVIMFDLVGVLIKENDFALQNPLDKLKRLFESNLSEDEYYEQASKYINDKLEIIDKTIKK